MKTVYVCHSKNYNFVDELYVPIKNSNLVKACDVVFPHESSFELFDSKSLFRSGVDLVVAEVGMPSTGIGIELGWANLLGSKIVCIFKSGTKITSSLNAVCNTFIEYTDKEDLVEKINSLYINNI